MKYVIVTGGVISGLGKGITISCLGVLLQSYGLKITSIKIDPYINCDAGTMSPYEHGEVYVLADGGEADLDLGNYERFLDVKLGRDNNITTGKICKTVQVIPHVTNEIQDWITSVANRPLDKEGDIADICLVEVGGTVGDIESAVFLEAVRQLMKKVGRQNCCLLHVSLVPKLGVVGEHKTKPTQHTVKDLRGIGLVPDFVVCRSTDPIERETKEKLALFCDVDYDHIINIHDVKNIYQVPILLKAQKAGENIMSMLGLKEKYVSNLDHWEKLSDSVDEIARKGPEVKICMVGKYTDLVDSYISVVKSVYHAAYSENVYPKIIWVEATNLEESVKAKNPDLYQENWDKIYQCDGLIIPGGFGDRGIEGMIAASTYCRLNQKPFLGICLGLQVSVISYARDVLGWSEANSDEFVRDNAQSVIVSMPEHDVDEKGGTMRLGERISVFKDYDNYLPTSRMLYGGAKTIIERHRHRFEVNPEVVSVLEEKGLHFVATSVEGERMEILELDRAEHPYFVASQFHPEFTSRPFKPNPLFKGLILGATGRVEQFTNNEYEDFKSVNFESHLRPDNKIGETDAKKRDLLQVKGSSGSFSNSPKMTVFNRYSDLLSTNQNNAKTADAQGEISETSTGEQSTTLLKKKQVAEQPEEQERTTVSESNENSEPIKRSRITEENSSNNEQETSTGVTKTVTSTVPETISESIPESTSETISETSTPIKKTKHRKHKSRKSKSRKATSSSDITTPAENASTPAENASELAENVAAPVENASEPAENASEPAEQSIVSQPETVVKSNSIVSTSKAAVDDENTETTTPVTTTPVTAAATTTTTTDDDEDDEDKPKSASPVHISPYSSKPAEETKLENSAAEIKEQDKEEAVKDDEETELAKPEVPITPKKAITKDDDDDDEDDDDEVKKSTPVTTAATTTVPTTTTASTATTEVKNTQVSSEESSTNAVNVTRNTSKADNEDDDEDDDDEQEKQTKKPSLTTSDTASTTASTTAVASTNVATNTATNTATTSTTKKTNDEDEDDEDDEDDDKPKTTTSTATTTSTTTVAESSTQVDVPSTTTPATATTSPATATTTKKADDEEDEDDDEEDDDKPKTTSTTTTTVNNQEEEAEKPSKTIIFKDLTTKKPAVSDTTTDITTSTETTSIKKSTTPNEDDDEEKPNTVKKSTKEDNEDEEEEDDDDEKPKKKVETKDNEEEEKPKKKAEEEEDDDDEEEKPKKKAEEEEDEEEEKPKKKVEEEDDDDEEEKPKKKAEEDDDEEEEEKPKKKVDDDDEEEEKPKKKVDDDDEEEEKPKKKVDDDDDNDEEKPKKKVDDDDEEEEKPKKKVDDDDDDDDNEKDDDATSSDEDTFNDLADDEEEDDQSPEEQERLSNLESYINRQNDADRDGIPDNVQSFFVEALKENNKVTIKVHTDITGPMKVYCKGAMFNDAYPTEEELKKYVSEEGNSINKVDNTFEYIMKNNEEMVHCLGMDKKNHYYGIVSTEIDAILGKLEFARKIYAIHPTSVDIDVSVNKHSNVYCKAISKNSDIVPIKKTLIKSNAYNVQRTARISIKGLKPSEEYAVYCYAESTKKDPMNIPIQRTQTIITTPPADYSIENLVAKNGALSFHLRSNVDENSICHVQTKDTNNKVQSVRSKKVIAGDKQRIYIQKLTNDQKYSIYCDVQNNQQKLAITKKLSFTPRNTIIQDVLTVLAAIIAIVSVCVCFGFYLKKRNNTTGADRYKYGVRDIESAGLLSRNLNNNLALGDSNIIKVTSSSVTSSQAEEQEQQEQQKQSLLGNTLEQIECENCGALNDRNAYICTECNSIINANRDNRKKTHRQKRTPIA
ncbi:hypothetical protein WA158_002293 [Blastocystis sp. Blastoise]